MAEGPRGVVRQPVAARWGEVPGARRVTAVGDRLGRRVAVGGPWPAARQPPGQPVVRQQHPVHRSGVLGLAFGQPAQLGDGERHRRHGPGPRRPLLRAAEFRDKRGGLRRRLHIVPEHRGADHRSRVVERDHAMLLRRDPHGVRPFEQAAACRRQRLPPAIRVALCPVRVRCARLGDHRPVLGIDEDHLDGLRGGIDPCDQLHDGDGNKVTGRESLTPVRKNDRKISTERVRGRALTFRIFRDMRGGGMRGAHEAIHRRSSDNCAVTWQLWMHGVALRSRICRAAG